MSEFGAIYIVAVFIFVLCLLYWLNHLYQNCRCQIESIRTANATTNRQHQPQITLVQRFINDLNRLLDLFRGSTISRRRRAAARQNYNGRIPVIQNNSLQNFINSLRRGPWVNLDDDINLTPRVGENIAFKIYIPISMRNRRLQNQDEIKNEIMSESNIQILPLFETGDYQVAYIKEVQLYEDENLAPTNSEDIIHVKFTIKIAGLYVINISYRHHEVHIRGSGVLREFLPGEIDLTESSLIRNSPSILHVTGQVFQAIIETKDRFGNHCLSQDVDIAHFNLELFHEAIYDSYFVPVCHDLMYRCFPDFSQKNLYIRLEIEILNPGLYKGRLTFKNTLVRNGSFKIICLSPDENLIFRNYLSSSNVGLIYLEAKLQVYGDEVQKKNRQVYLYPAPKMLIVKEYFFGLIPRRLSAFRISTSTKIKHLFLNSETKCSTLEITERGQFKITVEIDETSGRVLLAIFNHYLEARLGGTESFENKKKFFYNELKNTLDPNLRINHVHQTISISRESIIESSLIQTRHFVQKDWCSKFKIHFQGELGADEGGLRKEWLDLFCVKMFENNPNGMFCSIGNSRLVHPNPNRRDKSNFKCYELAGKIVGKCLFESAHGEYFVQMVNARFTKSFLSQILGFSPCYEHFKQDDPELYSKKIKYILESDSIDSLDLTFTEEEYNNNGRLVKTVDLIPNGSKVQVTNENKECYLNALAKYKLNKRMAKEISAFLKGLHLIVPENLFCNFDENELEILLCGKSEFKLSDLKDHHIVTTPNSVMSKLLTWFWISIENMTDEEKTRLLQFTTGTSILPQGNFKELTPKFRISYELNHSRLPVAHTCFNEIVLSDHKTFEDFNKALKLAINECSIYGFS